MTNEEAIEILRKNRPTSDPRPCGMELCDVFVHGISATDEPIRYFYSTASGFYSAWHENSLEYVTTIGNHRFFKEK